MQQKNSRGSLTLCQIFDAICRLLIFLVDVLCFLQFCRICDTSTQILYRIYIRRNISAANLQFSISEPRVLSKPTSLRTTYPEPHLNQSYAVLWRLQSSIL